MKKIKIIKIKKIIKNNRTIKNNKRKMFKAKVAAGKRQPRTK